MVGLHDWDEHKREICLELSIPEQSPSVLYKTLLHKYYKICELSDKPHTTLSGKCPNCQFHEKIKADFICLISVKASRNDLLIFLKENIFLNTTFCKHLINRCGDFIYPKHTCRYKNFNSFEENQ